MFDVFPTWNDPFDATVPHFYKFCALINFYSKTLIFALLHEKRV